MPVTLHGSFVSGSALAAGVSLQSKYHWPRDRGLGGESWN
jgi:hypothetical protein